MADKPLKPVKLSFHGEFGWFIWGFIILGVVWFWSGGYNNESAHQGAYIKPLAPLDSGETYGNYYAGTPINRKETLNLPELPATVIRSTETAIQDLIAKTKEASFVHNTSILSHTVYFDGVAGAKSKDASTEYIRIIASGIMESPVNISGYGLEGTYFDGSIPLPRAGGKQDVIIYPGDRAIIATGISPVGSSFRVNVCSSYLAGADQVIPALRKSTYDPMSYIDCVMAHKNDSNFDSKEWRIFLGQKAELWRNSNEIIKLVDTNGKVVDELAY